MSVLNENYLDIPCMYVPGRVSVWFNWLVTFPTAVSAHKVTAFQSGKLVIKSYQTESNGRKYHFTDKKHILDCVV